jgi:hypothetical protein
MRLTNLMSECFSHGLTTVQGARLIKTIVALLPLVQATNCKPLYSKNGLTWSKSALRMNEIQIIATHNSYHLEADDDEKKIQSTAFPSAKDIWYSHAALDVQTAYQSIRSFE